MLQQNLAVLKEGIHPIPQTKIVEASWGRGGELQGGWHHWFTPAPDPCHVTHSVPPRVYPVRWRLVARYVVLSLGCTPTCRRWCSAWLSCSRRRRVHRSCAQLLPASNTATPRHRQIYTTTTNKQHFKWVYLVHIINTVIKKKYRKLL